MVHGIVMRKDTRLIERWLPIAELGIESTRERTPMTPYPAPNRLHVWWARRPLVASRAAILASLLPADADRDRFLHVLGIHGDPVAARRRLDAAKKTGENLGPDPYGYKRTFSYSPTGCDIEWVEDVSSNKASSISVLDPTAGGGSIPIEASRLGVTAFANDLNPVAALILRATIEWPARHGSQLLSEFNELAAEFLHRAEPKYQEIFPMEPEDSRVDGYLWARTITCPYCSGLVPLSPNWRLAPGGIGVRLKPDPGAGPGSQGRVCAFEIVGNAGEQSEGTVARGDGACPWPDCGRVIDGDEIKRQAQSGRMGEQLYAIVYKKRIRTTLKSGNRGKDKWARGYRAPAPEDDNSADIAARLAGKLPEWEALDRAPSEKIPDGNKTTEPQRYGMPYWRDLFSARQLLCHGTSVEVFQEMLEADRKDGKLTDARRAAYGYLAFVIDTLLDYNNRCSVWDNTIGRVRHIFARHDFAFIWSYAEMSPLVTGVGYDWAIEKTAKCIRELISLLRPDAGGKGGSRDRPLLENEYTPPPITISCKSGDSLDHIEDGSMDAVVMDPPYYDNVMYAELSDFFYVWLKRTAGHVFPELFRRNLTDKESEAVANPARFRGIRGAKALAGLDYRERMASIFAECRRVLKKDGILTLMFTHKAAGAWDALAKGLMEAGFIVTASWPINTEAEGSLHIRNKAAANSTIFLVCRPRPVKSADGQNRYWEDVEPQVAAQVRSRIAGFQEAGISGVDLYLASFGPALEEFSRHWPLRRGTPGKKPEVSRGRQAGTVADEEWDPYAVTPEDALNVARREVKSQRLESLTRSEANEDMDPATAFFVLAWDAFRAPEFPYDEALKLARAIGADLDRDILGRLAHKKNKDIVLLSSVQRAAMGTLGPVDGARGVIDSIHHGARLARTRSLAAARDFLGEAQIHRGDKRFTTAMKAVLEVLPVGRTLAVGPRSDSDRVSADGGAQPGGRMEEFGSDFEALYHLSRLISGERFEEPKQFDFLQDGIS